MEKSEFNQLNENKADSEQLHANESLIISPEGKSHFISISKWSMFIAILGFITAIFIVLAGIGVIVISSVVGEYQDFQSLTMIPFSILPVGVIYIIYGAIYFIPSYWLYLFSSKIKKGVTLGQQETVDEGLWNLKRTFKFIGILTIIAIATMLLAIPIFFLFLGMIHTFTGF